MVPAGHPSLQKQEVSDRLCPRPMSHRDHWCANGCLANRFATIFRLPSSLCAHKRPSSDKDQRPEVRRRGRNVRAWSEASSGWREDADRVRIPAESERVAHRVVVKAERLKVRPNAIVPNTVDLIIATLTRNEVASPIISVGIINIPI